MDLLDLDSAQKELMDTSLREIRKLAAQDTFDPKHAEDLIEQFKRDMEALLNRYLADSPS